MPRARPTRRQVLQATGGTLLAGGLLPASTRATRAQSGEAWPQFGYDVANTGHAPDNTGPTDTIQTQWHFNTAGPVESSPAVVDGTVYVGSNDNNLYAVDAAGGTQQWAVATDGPVESSPAVVDGTVYVGSNDSKLYAVDATDGTRQWAFETDDAVWSSPAVVDSTIYVGSDDNNLYAVDAADGTQQWAVATDGAVWSSPAVVDGTVYVGSRDTKLYALTGLKQSLLGSADDQTTLLGLGALLTAGVGGGWWWRRQRRGTSPDDGPAPTSQDPDPTPPPDAADTQAHDTLRARLDRADSLRNDADAHREAGRYDRALDAYDKAHAAYQEALDTAKEGQRTNTDGIEQNLTAIQDARREAYRQHLHAEVASLRSELDRAGALADDGDVEKARVRLANVDSRLDSARKTATEHGFDDLHDEITTLERRQETLCDEIQTRDRLNKKIATLRSEMTDIDALADADESVARERLEQLESRLSTARDTAAQYDFDDLHEEITALERRREERLTELAEQLHTQPIPAEIPRAPDISVDYDTLTNEEPVGGGGSADVSKATLPTSDGDVTLAIKRPRMSGTLHTDQVERMLQEAETWAKLDDHDHIVGVVDYDSTPIPWIAMEYMDGGHLGERAGQTDTPQALWTAIAVTKGVRHAHRRGVAHLDLKPKNILFRTVEDAWDVPKVADWGLSKHLLDTSKSVEGLSPQYAAPEQFDDEYGPGDDMTDIYQLGAVFYELFTGRPPFEGKPAEAMHKVLHEQPTPPSAIADVPDPLDEILLTALAKPKPDRYDNIVYLRDALQELFDE